MADLSQAEVLAVASALHLTMTSEDAAEVAYRLNALIEALAPLSALPASGPAAVPAPIDPDR